MIDNADNRIDSHAGVVDGATDSGAALQGPILPGGITFGKYNLY